MKADLTVKVGLDATEVSQRIRLAADALSDACVALHDMARNLQRAAQELDPWVVCGHDHPSGRHCAFRRAHEGPHSR